MLRLADATWAEVRDLFVADPLAIALLPIGATEAHGPHLPLATDVIIAEGLAKRAALALEAVGRHVACAPPIVYSVTDYAGGFAGTVSISSDTARAYVAEVCGGLARSGFRRVCLVNAHLEPSHVQCLLGAVVDAKARGVDVIFADNTERRFARTLTDEYKRGACHAGSYETSLVLAERPDLVRDLRTRLPAVPIDLVQAMKQGKATFLEAGAAEAYFGDPARASVSEGEWIFARLVDMVMVVVRETW